MITVKNTNRIGRMALLVILVLSGVLFSDILKLQTEKGKYKKSSDDNDRSVAMEKDEYKKADEISSDIHNAAVSTEVPVTSTVTVSSADFSKTFTVTFSITSESSSVTSDSSVIVTTVPVTTVTEPETAAPETAPPEEYREPETQPPPEPEPEPQPEPAPEPEQPPAPPENNYPSASEYQSEVLRLVNIKRSEAGAGPLSASDALNYCAQIRADETVNVFSHQRPDGSECFSVLSQNGISAFSAAENIAAGSPDPASVVEQWMNSDSHRKNMLNPAYKSMGVGYSRDDSDDYVHYWVQLFTG